MMLLRDKLTVYTCTHTCTHTCSHTLLTHVLTHVRRLLLLAPPVKMRVQAVIRNSPFGELA